MVPFWILSSPAKGPERRAEQAEKCLKVETANTAKAITDARKEANNKLDSMQQIVIDDAATHARWSG